jgi:integrase
MPRTGRNIYKRKDGRWEGRYPKGRDMNLRLIYGYVYGKTYTEVKQRLSGISIEDSKPVSPVIPVTKNSSTFADVADQLLSVISMQVKPSTYAGYTATLDLHIIPALGKRRIQSLTAVDISHFAREKLESGRKDGKGGLSAKTVRDMLSIIKAVTDFACEQKIIGSGIKIAYPKQPPQTMRVLSRQEQSSLEAVLATDTDIYKVGMMLCLYTGLRIGEVCALRWQDISPEFDTLSVRQTLQRIKDVNGEGDKTKILIDTPKSLRSVRDIPIPMFLSSYLRDYARDGRAYILGTDSGVFTEPRTLQNHFARNVKAAKINSANYHSLRHTFATRCVEAGVDIKSLSEMLGHASVNITLNRYVHSSFDQKRDGMNKLEQYIRM